MLEGQDNLLQTGAATCLLGDTSTLRTVASHYLILTASIVKLNGHIELTQWPCNDEPLRAYVYICEKVRIPRPPPQRRRLADHVTVAVTARDYAVN